MPLSDHQIQERPHKANLPIFLLSSVFLIAILLLNGLNQWQQSQRMFLMDVHNTLDGFAQQAGLLAQASHQVNTVISRSLKPLLIRAIHHQAGSTEQLQQELSAAIFNFTGYSLLDENGKAQVVYGEELHINETADQWANILSLNEKYGMFILRYGKQGGFYFYTRFNDENNNNYYLVVRRSFDKFSSIIYNGRFNNFEMILLDTRNNSIGMRASHYIDSSNQPVFNPNHNDQIIYRTPIASTHLEVAAIPTPDRWLNQLIALIKQPILVLLTFFFFSFILWRRLKNQRTIYEKEKIQKREIEKRAKKATEAIKDVFFSTDQNGRITYSNQIAKNLFKNYGEENVNGKLITDIINNTDAIWCRGLDDNELESYKAKPLKINPTKTEYQYYEQLANPFYEQNKLEGVVWVLRDITESEKSKIDIEKNQAKYKILFEETSVGHLLINTDQIISGNDVFIKEINSAALSLMNKKNKNDFISHLFLPKSEERKILENQIKQAKALGKNSLEFELPIPSQNERVNHFWFTISLGFDAESNALISFIDITEQKNNSERLREREAFWTKIMTSVSDLIYLAKIKEKETLDVIYYNKNIGYLLGYSSDIAETAHWTFFVEKDELEQLKGINEKIMRLKQGEVNEFTVKFRHAKGNTRILEFHVTPFQFNDNEVSSMYIGTIRDITEEIERQEQIAESERRYRLLAENIDDIIWATDTKLKFNFVSSSIYNILGYHPDEVLRENGLSIFRRRDIRKIMISLNAVLQKAEQCQPNEFRNHQATIKQDIIAIAKHGHEVLLELKAGPLWNDNGELQGIIGTCRNINETRQLENEIIQSAEVFSKTNEGILITDKNQKIIKVNNAFKRITGYSDHEIIGFHPSFFVSAKNHQTNLIDSVEEKIKKDQHWHGEIFYKKKDNSIRTCWAGISAVFNENEQLQSLIIIISDITERKLSEEKIQYLAYYDHLTGLPNRSQLNDKLNTILINAKESKQHVALLFLDLDRFKPINDSMGHPVGDIVLKEVARRLKDCVKEDDFVCRMGGDEFTLVLAKQASNKLAIATAKKVSERIIKELNKPYYLQQKEVFLGCSIGVSLYPQDGKTAVELIKNSDMAMYHAKEIGRNNVQFFNDIMKQKAIAALELENDLRYALDREEFQIYYQPQFDSQSKKIVAAEALLRWHHPQKGIINPTVFIPVIEDSGLIIPIGDWVLNQACQQLASWQENGLVLNRISINVSARQFKQTDFIAKVQEALSLSGIRPEQLELELTESILIDNIEHTLQALRSLRALKVRIAIDDFGTGYSSLNYLKQFPVDTLKIDRSFIQNLPENQDDAQITRTIIAMAHNLGLGVIAEGVETPEQLHFLAQAKCEEVQGFLFSKPIPAHEFWHHYHTNSSITRVNELDS